MRIETLRAARYQWERELRQLKLGDVQVDPVNLGPFDALQYTRDGSLQESSIV